MIWQLRVIHSIISTFFFRHPLLRLNYSLSANHLSKLEHLKFFINNCFSLTRDNWQVYFDVLKWINFTNTCNPEMKSYVLEIGAPAAAKLCHANSALPILSLANPTNNTSTEPQSSNPHARRYVSQSTSVSSLTYIYTLNYYHVFQYSDWMFISCRRSRIFLLGWWMLTSMSTFQWICAFEILLSKRLCSTLAVITSTAIWAANGESRASREKFRLKKSFDTYINTSMHSHGRL